MFQFKEVAVQCVATQASGEAFTQTTQPGSAWDMRPRPGRPGARPDPFPRQGRLAGGRSERANQTTVQFHPAPEQGWKEHDPALEATT
jgi:hypothetical protein